MCFASKKCQGTFVVNDSVSLVGIPRDEHRYAVRGRTPLEWSVLYYRKKLDQRNGIVSDTNKWFAHICDLITTIRQIIYLSAEEVKIVNVLPDPLANSEQDKSRQR